jgi:hypothetical protein
MKINRFVYYFLVIILFESCISFKETSFRKMTIQTDDKNKVIEFAIQNFSKNCRLYKTDTVFSVCFIDTLHRLVLKKLDDRNYKWVRGEIYEGIVAVCIVGTYNSFLLTKDTKIGSKGTLPSRFIEKDKKLFYWWDDDYPLTEKTLEIFHKYNLLQDDEGGIIKIPDFITDDSKKGVDYYFCKNDLTKYKKVITNKGIGYYKPPKLNCDCEK